MVTTDVADVLSKQAISAFLDVAEQALLWIAGEKGTTHTEIERRWDGSNIFIRLTWQPQTERDNPGVLVRSIVVTVDSDHRTTQVEANAWSRDLIAKMLHRQYQAIGTFAIPPDVDQLRQAVAKAYDVAAGWGISDLTISNPIPKETLALMGQL